MKTLFIMVLKFIVILSVLVFGMMLIAAYVPSAMTSSVTIFGHQVPDSYGMLACLLLLVECITHW